MGRGGFRGFFFPALCKLEMLFLKIWCLILQITNIKNTNIKGVGSISFLKNRLKKFWRKKCKNHLRGNNYEVGFSNILDVMVFKNINLS
jgi:hypothetical protein